MDLDNTKSELVTREFIAVVLAGFGNEYVSFRHQEHWMLTSGIRLLPLTSDYGDEPCPKSLLPIANKPLLDYTLVWLEQSGVKGTLQYIIHYLTTLNHSYRCPSHLPC